MPVLRRSHGGLAAPTATPGRRCAGAGNAGAHAFGAAGVCLRRGEGCTFGVRHGRVCHVCGLGREGKEVVWAQEEKGDAQVMSRGWGEVVRGRGVGGIGVECALSHRISFVLQ